MTKKHDIIWLESADSTNEECRRRISDIDNLSVLSAFTQTSGRGQQGNSWHSESGKNLTFSIVLKFFEESIVRLRATDQFVLSQIAALSIVELLSRHDIEARIKWPNDIYVGQNKICGILIENSLRGEWISHSIIGIGLNVNQRNFDVNLPNPVSMALLRDGSAPQADLYKLLEEFMDIFKKYYRCLSDPMSLHLMYLSLLWRKDTPSKFISESLGTFTGTIRSISEKGCLLVEVPEGIIYEFSFKEISYVL